jgi:hypothetical protein
VPAAGQGVSTKAALYQRIAFMGAAIIHCIEGVFFRAEDCNPVTLIFEEFCTSNRK